jgi:hypothetical protein
LCGEHLQELYTVYLTKSEPTKLLYHPNRGASDRSTPAAKSLYTSIFKKRRPIEFGVFIVFWSTTRYLEGPEQANAAEDGHAQRRHHVGHGEHHLQDRGDHHEEVEPVEQRDEVEVDAESVHLEEHLEGEQDDEGEVGRLLEGNVASSR